jgi:hypothetical protein
MYLAHPWRCSKLWLYQAPKTSQALSMLKRSWLSVWTATLRESDDHKSGCRGPKSWMRFTDWNTTERKPVGHPGT